MTEESRYLSVVCPTTPREEWIDEGGIDEGRGRVGSHSYLISHYDNILSERPT